MRVDQPSQDITDNHDEIAWYRNVVGFRCREPTSKYTQYLEVSVTGQDIASFVTSFQEPELKSRAGGSKEGSCGSSIDRRITTTVCLSHSANLCRTIGIQCLCSQFTRLQAPCKDKKQPPTVPQSVHTRHIVHITTPAVAKLLRCRTYRSLFDYKRTVVSFARTPSPRLGVHLMSNADPPSVSPSLLTC